MIIQGVGGCDGEAQGMWGCRKFQNQPRVVAVRAGWLPGGGDVQGNTCGVCQGRSWEGSIWAEGTAMQSSERGLLRNRKQLQMLEMGTQS